ncbi:MAG: C39 family peptidase [Ktedonobacteraceae bacterium]
MPAMLILLFIIALTITLVGLFLSPKHPTRHARHEYLITPRGRRSVEEAIIPARSGRQVDSRARRHVDTNRASVLVAKPKVWGARTEGAWKWFVPGMAVIFMLCLYLLNITFPHSPIWTFASFGQPAPITQPNTSQPVYIATQQLVRVGQLDPAQYQSQQEYITWGDSACSAASMTEVINAYGHHYRVTDILQVEAGIHEITPQLGLLEDVGIQRTAAKFGFKTAWGYSLSLDQVISAASKGTPVIVSFPPSRFPGGHLLIVRGGDSNSVYLTDSSARNWTQLSRTRFMQLWAGFSAILTPA